ncbi:hypothetical protein Nepgr_001205 [Nepenthes gracilis]|uniref:ABC transporter domain-containing protein n=1 Tax=Nepenthes gracilis TaxID=150966 RepID=A0AAD3P404_NEPGR|nr:hypothetical protein Nepgr_001205 [Nepenthes gracilis]
MSRVVDDNFSTYPSIRLSYFNSRDRRERMDGIDNDVAASSMSAGGVSVSATLGQLLKHVGDVRGEVNGDETPVHRAIEMDASLDLRSLPFVLCFSDLTYSVKVRRKITLFGSGDNRNRLESAINGGENVNMFPVEPRSKTLLNNISGEARDGEILAVLGASGSGKSTLIDALANRIAKGSLKGSITLNGEALESRLLKVISAYVMQDDLLFPMLTVEETLTFAAEFRLPRTLSKSKKDARVQQLIDQLGLRSAAKTVIGDEGHRGVSGGERRRVSIGIDIIHDPIILFLDEPTSGLDSTSAFMVVKVLQRIAQSGSIVIMSVHQPSYRILRLLDRLIFLSRGHTVYSGSPSDLPAFFAEFGNPIPECENRAEFALDFIRELEGSAGGTKSLVEFNKQWMKQGSRNHQSDERQGLTLKEAISASISRGKLVSGATSNDATTPTNSVPTFANPFWIELAVLSKRSMTNSRRMPELFGIRLGAVLVTGFILATMFWRLDDSPKGVQERLGFFAFAMSTTFYTTADALPVFLQQRYIFMRETAYNAYRRSSYVLSHAITALPALIFLSLAFAATTFWAVGLDGGLSGFFFYFGIILASFWAGNSFVSFLSGVVPHVMLGFTIVVAILAYFLLFSGFFISRDRIPNYWIWFHYLSLVKYPYEGVLQNEFQDPTRCFERAGRSDRFEQMELLVDHRCLGLLLQNSVLLLSLIGKQKQETVKAPPVLAPSIGGHQWPNVVEGRRVGQYFIKMLAPQTETLGKLEFLTNSHRPMLLSTRSTNLWFQRTISILSPFLTVKLHQSIPVVSKRNAKPFLRKDEDCHDFLLWLEEKAGVKISSVLSIGNSNYGRSLFASDIIQTGDCMLRVPFSVQLSPDNILPEIKPLLGDEVGNVAKLAIVILVEQKRGQDSQWAQYISRLPQHGEMHSTIFWSLDELEMIQPSSLYQGTIAQQSQIRKEFMDIKPVLDCFPEIFEDVRFVDFKHAYALVGSRAWGSMKGLSLIPFADFLNHDGTSESVVLSDEAKQISEVIADRNYDPGEEVLIRYGRFPNSTLLMDFGFTLPFNSYDQAQVQIDIPLRDNLRAMKLEILNRYCLPAIKDVNFNSLGASFLIKEVKSATGKGKGIPQSLRAFGRVLCCNSPRELNDLGIAADQSDGRLARHPLIDRRREIQAHQILLSHIDKLIEEYNSSIERLWNSNWTQNCGLVAQRRRMAQDLLTGELRVLKSASAWLKNYCAT